MMKFIFMIFLMNLMLLKNNMIMFYYNMCYIISFMMTFKYMVKDIILFSNISMNIGTEYYSILLMMLSAWIVGLMFMCLDNNKCVKMYIFVNMLVMLLMFFMELDLMLFYLMFEISLIPTFFLIVYWGSNVERLSAVYYLMMYMLFISFPLLVYILNIYHLIYSLKFSLMVVMNLFMFSFWGYLMIYMAFFIKMPMYLMHIWLPKAHVEAPVYGSMILAGVLLKMGSYGLIRLMLVFLKVSVKMNYLIMSVSIVGSILVSILCLVQIDMKSLVAYSSVVHMNMMLCSMLTLFKLGFLSSYIMMISHGLCSSGLFYMVNIYYVRTGSRLLLLNKGMMSVLSTMSMWWFLLCVTNFSFPFSLNFFSELLMLSVILNWDLFMMVYLMLVCFFSSAYSLYLFSYIQHGSVVFMSVSINMGELKEFIILIFHFYPLLLYLLNLIMLM